MDGGREREMGGETKKKKWQQCKWGITCSRYITCYPVMKRRREEEGGRGEGAHIHKLSP